MIKIKVNNKEIDNDLMNPCEMIGTPHGTIFQQYHDGIMCEEYYVSCGGGENSVIHIWHSDEDNKYRLSTDNVKSLTELYNTVKVKEIDATIEINLTIEE